MRISAAPSANLFSTVGLLLGLTLCSSASAQVKQPTNASAPTGINLDKPFTPPADVKIDVAQFGSLPQGTTPYVSAHGANVAMLVHAGSRVQIVYDGVAGPVFDGFTGAPNTSVWFSPDGNHYGYCGFAGNQMTVMVDSKQVGTTSDLYINQFDCQIVLSPNSKHFYLLNHVGTDGQHFHARLVVDGKQEVDVGDIHAQNFVFSPDGEHFAALLDAYNSPRPTQEVVVDGKITPWPAASPVWSADSQHVFTIGGVGQKQILYRDGQPLMTAGHITLGAQPLNPGLTAPPAGDTPIAIGYDSNGGASGVLQEQWYLTTNGKQIPGTLLQKTRGTGAQIQNLLVSQDGKHYAAICKGANGKTYLFNDGKRGLDYDGINPTQVQFTSGTFQPVYVAINANAMYLIVGSQETAIPNTSNIVVSSVGDHVAAVGRAGFLDGQPLNLSTGGGPQTTQVSAFNFSPDGKHYAYVVLGKGSALNLYVDGVPDTAHGWIVPSLAGGKTPLWTHGDNIVYECGSANPATANQVDLCLDGKYAYLANKPVFGNLTLTPDASHIFFSEGIANAGFRLFLDGAPLLEGFPLMGVAGFPPGTWEVESNGALEILTQDKTTTNVVKRYTITPGTSTSLAALMSGGQH